MAYNGHNTPQKQRPAAIRITHIDEKNPSATEHAALYSWDALRGRDDLWRHIVRYSGYRLHSGPRQMPILPILGRRPLQAFVNVGIWPWGIRDADKIPDAAGTYLNLIHLA